MTTAPSVPKAAPADDRDEESQIVLDQADRLFRDIATKSALEKANDGTWLAEMWRAVEVAGFPLALVPEASGGSGLATGTAFRLIRLAGYYAMPLPLGETMVAAALWAAASGNTISGPLSLAALGVDGKLTVEKWRDRHALFGEMPYVPWGANVAQVLGYARSRSGETFLVLVSASEAREHRHQLNLAGEPRVTMVFEGITITEICPTPRLCTGGLLRFGALVRVYQMLGAMQRCLEYALSYAMDRQQFGRPIARFQAVQHMLAQAAGEYAAAESAAAVALESFGSDTFPFCVAIAKVRAGEAAGKVADFCHQVHGAMGFTQEHPLHFSTRRLWSWRDEYGNETFWAEEIGRTVCAYGGEGLLPMLSHT